MSGDLGSGINVVAMEVMHNICQRYRATARCLVTVREPFNRANVTGWLEKLKVNHLVTAVEDAKVASIEILDAQGLVARLLPFAEDFESADAWIVIRRTVLATGRLPGVELRESGSRHLTDSLRELTQRVASQVERGNQELANYLAQPFFLAEAWTSKAGEVTEPEDTLIGVQRYLWPNGPS